MSYKSKFNKALVFALASFFVGSVAVAAEDSAVNDYDCSLPELREYIQKKTDYFVNSPTSITTWEEFKRQDILEGAGTGAFPKDGDQAGGKDGEEPEEKCNYFWGDIDDWDVDINSGLDVDGVLDKINKYKDMIGKIMSGDLGSLVQEVQDRLIEQTNKMLDEVKKGVCKRLSSANVKKEIYRAADKYLSNKLENALGSIPVDLIDGNYDGYVSDILMSSYGSNGKLLNVFDSSLDSKRESFIQKETQRQFQKMINR